jgi:metal-dependent amidase/aminoacylase/carboxypeptidase family protein
VREKKRESNHHPSLKIKGRQTHASTPHRGNDPIVQAASTILRLQTIVAREVDPLDFAVVTVAAIHAGDAENVRISAPPAPSPQPFPPLL